MDGGGGKNVKDRQRKSEKVNGNLHLRIYSIMT